MRKGPKFHNSGTNDVNCKAEWDHQSYINIKDRVWQTVFVRDILQACMRMCAISVVACEKVEKGNFSACKEGNRRCVHPGNIEVAMVGKIEQIKPDNWITNIYN